MKKLSLITKQYQDIVDKFRAYLRTKNYSEGSQKNCPYHVREFLHFMEQRNTKLNQWQPTDFKDFVKYIKTRKNELKGTALSNGYINKILQSLHLLQHYLSAVDKLDFYAKLPLMKVISHEMEIFSEEDIFYLYDCCKNNHFGLRMRCILALCYGCGLRRGEATRLHLEDIWWERNLLQVKKSKIGKNRLIPLTKSVQEDLKYYYEKSRPKFEKDQYQSAFLLSNLGNPLSSSSLYYLFKKLLKTAGFEPCGVHKLRHSIASHLAASGMKSELIARFLGHVSLDSTQIYVHLKAETHANTYFFKD